MTFEKMRTLLNLLAVCRNAHGWSVHGRVAVTAGGELAFDFTSQPEGHLVRFLKGRGFVAQPDDPNRYVYRPRTRLRIDSVLGGPRVLTRKTTTRI